MEIISDILFNMAHYVQYISFGLLLLAGLNLPVSEDIVFIVSASIAATIVPENTIYIFIGCFAGAYFSDIEAYLIGRFAGPKLLETKFFKKLISKEKISKIEKYFDKYHMITLFFGRFIPFGVRNVLFFTSGLTKIKFIRFATIDFIALSITSSILYSIGFILGKNYKLIFPYLNQYKYIIFAIFICLILIFALKKRYFKVKKVT